MSITGMIIGTLVVVGLIVGIALEVVRGRRTRPTYWIQTPTTKIGVRWFTDSTIWPGFERAMLAIEHVLYLRYGADVVRKKGLMDFWVEVYPKNMPLRTTVNPSGKNNGRTVNGAVQRTTRYFGFSRKYVVLVMQHHKIKTKLPNGETWQDGELLDAGASAIFHEVAEHFVPLKLKGNINARHADEWKLLTSEMRQAYRMLSEANGKVD